MQQFVTRVGLRLLFRFSDLILIAEKLEANGFQSRADFLSLSAAKATELGIAEKLAEALKDEAAGPPDYRKVSSVKPLREQNDDEIFGPQGPGAAHEIHHIAHAHVSAGHPTFETRVEGVHVSHPFHGFPFALRDYEPMSPASPRRSMSPLCGPASPREEPAFKDHIVRQSSARRLRTAQQDELNIGGGRCDSSPDPWKAMSCHQTGGSAFMGTSRNRCIAGFDSWTKVKNMTRDISPTYVGGVANTPEHHNDYGWGSHDSSPRRHGARLKKGHSGSPLTIPESVQVSRLPLRKLRLTADLEAVVIVQPTTLTSLIPPRALAAQTKLVETSPQTQNQATMVEAKATVRTWEDENTSEASTMPPTPSGPLGVTPLTSGEPSHCGGDTPTRTPAWISNLGLASGKGPNTPRSSRLSPRLSERTTITTASSSAMASAPMKAPALPRWALP